MSMLQQVQFVPAPQLKSAQQELELLRRAASGLELELRERLRKWNPGASQEWIDHVVARAKGEE